MHVTVRFISGAVRDFEGVASTATEGDILTLTYAPGVEIAECVWLASTSMDLRHIRDWREDE